jgi:hypothetical protein
LSCRATGKQKIQSSTVQPKLATIKNPLKKIELGISQFLENNSTQCKMKVVRENKAKREKQIKEHGKVKLGKVITVQAVEALGVAGD